ncbi:MAG: hypothetical protein J0L70_23185 [Leptolyngbya sp. UWPOB_LEPTO1]|uniref:hypothetical protein n=1 Tax=Leptolyngbya sp. UWPOB_LEPTO1 TaxID=2815653 RepID=UPI001AC8F95D|nr:hypothetical protein [Leptolyngbya sp. UWPOB_LEPTO1]MBN8563445.1 hypothetical protein [Leptolyngbya sp. UWPOB_LEPTO1]
MLNPSEQIEQYFGLDRSPWKLLNLQSRLKKAKSPEARAAINQEIENTVRSLALLYSNLHQEGYQSGLEFGKQNAQFYADAEQYQQRAPHLKIEVRRHERTPVMVVNGRTID